MVVVDILGSICAIFVWLGSCRFVIAFAVVAFAYVPYFSSIFINRNPSHCYLIQVSQYFTFFYLKRSTLFSFFLIFVRGFLRFIFTSADRLRYRRAFSSGGFVSPRPHEYDMYANFDGQGDRSGRQRW